LEFGILLAKDYYPTTGTQTANVAQFSAKMFDAAVHNIESFNIEATLATITLLPTSMIKLKRFSLEPGISNIERLRELVN